MIRRIAAALYLGRDTGAGGKQQQRKQRKDPPHRPLLSRRLSACNSRKGNAIELA